MVTVVTVVLAFLCETRKVFAKRTIPKLFLIGREMPYEPSPTVTM
jgi:hypothetical protein